MSKPIRRKNGEFAGSIGDGKTPPPSSPATEVTETEGDSAQADTVAAAWSAYKGQYVDEHKFSLWERNPALNVCEICGKDASNELHNISNPFAGSLSRDPRYSPYEAAIWSWTVRNGGISSYYGGLDEYKSARVSMHLEACGIDHGKSQAPHVTTIDEFGGTDSPADQVEVSLASVTCRCGAIENLPWRILGKRSVNEIVFEIVREGDMNEDTTVPMREPSEKYVKWLKEAIDTASRRAGSPLSARKFIETELTPALYRAYYPFSKEDARIWGRDEEQISEGTWDKVSHTIARMDKDDLVAAKKLLAPFSKSEVKNMSFAEKRLYGLSTY